jgi:uncharacterized membrane protein YeaQ/YmgE (transglycosylase-associated protein family)
MGKETIALRVKIVCIIIVCLMLMVALFFGIFTLNNGMFLNLLFNPGGGVLFFLIPALVAAIFGLIASLIKCAVTAEDDPGVVPGCIAGIVGALLFSVIAIRLNLDLTVLFMVLIVVFFAAIGAGAGALFGSGGGIIGNWIYKFLPLSEKKCEIERLIAVPLVCLALLAGTVFRFGPDVLSGLNRIAVGIQLEASRPKKEPEPPKLELTKEMIAELCNRNGPVIKNGIAVNVYAKNAAVRIYRVAYAENWTVISITRTDNSAKVMNLYEPGESGAYYLETEDGKKYGIRGIRHFQDRVTGAGADLIFDAVGIRRFNMIEGDRVNDGWHFYNVVVP